MKILVEELGTDKFGNKLTLSALQGLSVDEVFETWPDATFEVIGDGKFVVSAKRLGTNHFELNTIDEWKYWDSDREYTSKDIKKLYGILYDATVELIQRLNIPNVSEEDIDTVCERALNDQNCQHFLVDKIIKCTARGMLRGKVIEFCFHFPYKKSTQCSTVWVDSPFVIPNKKI